MMKCRQCQTDVDLATAVDASPFSWPNMQTIWHVCPVCKVTAHLRFIPDGVQRIEIVGAPGPTWDVLETYRRPGIVVRSEPDYLHVWIDGIEHVSKARQ